VEGRIGAQEKEEVDGGVCCCCSLQKEVLVLGGVLLGCVRLPVSLFCLSMVEGGGRVSGNGGGREAWYQDTRGEVGGDVKTEKMWSCMQYVGSG
jgi:hypothetical protein